MKNFWLQGNKNHSKSMKTCIEIAARIWCDKSYSDTIMDVNACKRIARILFKAANK